MNIKDLQITKAFKEATDYILKRGKSPSFSQINDYVKKKFEKAPAGLPSFKPLFGKKYDCSNPHEYNFMLAKIKSDLDDLYDADNHFNNQLISSFNYYDTEKKRIDNMINDVQNRLDKLLDGINKPMSKDSIFENFDDFSKIDFIGAETRNIPGTSTYVDLLSKSASNDADFVRQIPLNKATTKIDILSSVISNKMLSDVKNCLGDSINQSWIQEIVSDSNTGVKIKLTIELSNEVNINTIKYSLQSPREAVVKLSIMNSNNQERQLREISTRNNAEWNFKSTKVKTICFEIFKSEPDAISGVDFIYYVGAKRIGIFNNSYYNKSVVVSKPYPITHPFSKIYSQMDQSLPPQTSIKYFVCIDRGDNEVSWMKINDNNHTDLGLLNTAKVNISREYSAGYGDTGLGGHVLATLKDKPVVNTSNLYIGNNMWEVRTLPLQDGVLDIRNLVSSADMAYKDMDNTKYNVPGNSARIFTTNVYCSKPCAIKVFTRAMSDSAKIKLYINSISIEKIDDYYMARLTTGWNLIQVLYVNEGASSDILLNAYFNDVADIVRAVKEPAQEVPLSDLMYGTHSKEYNKFAIVDNCVIVNYDPIEANMNAVIEYRYVSNPTAFENANIRVMAVFESLSRDVTPKLSNYKIITM